MPDKGWSRAFDDPIPLPPRGRQLVTLADAADYIMKLPKAEQNLEEWQTAVRCLIGAPKVATSWCMRVSACRGR
jgi:hypothetical protein